MIEALLNILAFFSAVYFVGTQGAICVAMPAEWFGGLVSGTVFAVCLLAMRR